MAAGNQSRDLDRWALQQGSIYFARDEPSSPAPKKPALRTFGTVLDTNRDTVRLTKMQDTSVKVYLSSDKELKSTNLIQSPPKEYTYMMVQNPLSEIGRSSIEDQLLNQAATITTLQKEMEKMKEHLNPVYGLHCLSTREIIAHNLAFSTLKLVDEQLTSIIMCKYRRRPDDTHRERLRKQRRRMRMDRFRMGNKHSYLALLRHRRARSQFTSILEETEESFLKERYGFTPEEARARAYTCVRRPFLKFGALRAHRNLYCHLFEKSSPEARSAQLAVVEDILKSISEGWLRNTETEPVLPLLQLELQKRKDELQPPLQA